MGVEWLTPRPSRFAPGKIPGSYCTVGALGHRAGLDGNCEIWKKEYILISYSYLNGWLFLSMCVELTQYVPEFNYSHVTLLPFWKTIFFLVKRKKSPRRNARRIAALLILSLGSSWRHVARLAPRPFDSSGKKIAGSHSLFRRLQAAQNVLPLKGIVPSSSLAMPAA